MAKFPQKSDSKGSLRDIQVLVNEFPHLLNLYLSETCSSTHIEWVSPIKSKSYMEYRDKDFLEELKLGYLADKLKQFWPNNGPQWDGLGKSEDGKIFLIEAKANIPEILSPPSGAKDSRSQQLINKSLTEVKHFVGSKAEVDWSQVFYQYCNRLAHLYFLRVQNQIPAYLVFVYFVDDKSVKGPQTTDEWKGALRLMKQYLGIDKKHKLSPYVIDVFINTKDINIT